MADCRAALRCSVPSCRLPCSPGSLTPPPVAARRSSARGSPSPSSAASPPARSRALAAVVLDPRLLGLRGEPADARAVRHRRRGRRTSSCSTRRATRRRATAIRAAMERALEASPGCARELVLLDRQPRVRLAGPAHDLHGALSGRRGGASTRRAAPRRSAQAAQRAAGRASPSHVTGRDPIMEANAERRARRPERPRRSADRRPRRARHPALRLRDAAGGADAARDRGRRRS